MTEPLGAPPASWTRPLLIALILIIMVSCTISAYLGIKAGHPTRAASTFFAGLAFSLLFVARLPRRPQ